MDLHGGGDCKVLIFGTDKHEALLVMIVLAPGRQAHREAIALHYLLAKDI